MKKNKYIINFAYGAESITVETGMSPIEFRNFLGPSKEIKCSDNLRVINNTIINSTWIASVQAKEGGSNV